MSDKETADKDNSRDRRSPRPSTSVIAQREVTEHEKSDDAQAEYQRILADKEAYKARLAAQRAAARRKHK